jgi:hypothetical protein
MWVSIPSRQPMFVGISKICERCYHAHFEHRQDPEEGQYGYMCTLLDCKCTRFEPEDWAIEELKERGRV